MVSCRDQHRQGGGQEVSFSSRHRRGNIPPMVRRNDSGRERDGRIKYLRWLIMLRGGGADFGTKLRNMDVTWAVR
jgi:hypothetical protein